MLIRSLALPTDRALVEAFFTRSADYIRLERDEDPTPDVTDAFFNETPPGCDPLASLRLGLFHPRLCAIAEIALGYPAAQDAYLGLMMVDPAARGIGVGVILLRHLEAVARVGGMQNLYLAVLQANPRGRAFWEREGFTVALANQTTTLGKKTQLVDRMGKSI